MTASLWTSVSQPFTDLWNKFIEAGPRYVMALAILVTAWLVSRLAKTLIKKSISRASTQGHIDILIARIVSGIILGIGFLLALGEIGISLSGLLAAVGLASLGIGFALQDILSNLFAGIILLLQHPFTIGDQVMIGQEEGTVENVRIRDTQILTYEGERVYIPNQMVFSNPIVNYTSTPSLRIDVRISIRYDADVDKARRLIKEVLKSKNGILEQPEPMILSEAEPEALILVARFWMGSDRNRRLNVQSEVLELIVKSFNSAGITIPYPIRTVEFLPNQEADADTDITKTRMMKTIPPDID
ncbi:MAG: mechanosensitive ion channel [Actinobacteria bacterium]|nr:mechanosensitive ion channel [Actinomycetota bacterium]